VAELVNLNASDERETMTIFDWAVALGGGIVMILSARRIRSLRVRTTGNSADEALDEIAKQERSPFGQLTKLEVRAYDQFRVLEAKLETRIAILDRLNQEAAEREQRLTALLARIDATQQQPVLTDQSKPCERERKVA
jgi:hypothetical protein